LAQVSLIHRASAHSRGRENALPANHDTCPFWNGWFWVGLDLGVPRSPGLHFIKQMVGLQPEPHKFPACQERTAEINAPGRRQFPGWLCTDLP